MNAEMDDWKNLCMYVCVGVLFVVFFKVMTKSLQGASKGKSLPWPVLVGTAWWQELRVAGSVELTVRKQKEVNVGTHLALSPFLFAFSLSPTPCRQSGWVFPFQLAFSGHVLKDSRPRDGSPR